MLARIASLYLSFGYKILFAKSYTCAKCTTAWQTGRHRESQRCWCTCADAEKWVYNNKLCKVFDIEIGSHWAAAVYYLFLCSLFAWSDCQDREILKCIEIRQRYEHHNQHPFAYCTFLLFGKKQQQELSELGQMCQKTLIWKHVTYISHFVYWLRSLLPLLLLPLVLLYAVTAHYMLL